MYDNIEKPEKALAVSVQKKGYDRKLAMEHLDELDLLAETAGAFVIEKIYQELEKPNPSTVVGKGKLEEIKAIVDENQVSVIIFDDELSPAQVRNLERELNIKALDRSNIILDIFAKRAKSLEAITQVELAQLQYMLPRLTRLWTHLSKQYGGVGTKGPGETQIETDRRMIRQRIITLKDKIKAIDNQKVQQRKNRESFPRFALVGYTNAGKSTIMNTLTNADVYVEDKLFATLDTTVRVFEFPNGQKALLSDTVGFIRKLPTHLIASFRSTLSEAAEADVLLHLVDINHSFFREHIKVVNDTLKALKIEDKPIILVFNKVDMMLDKYELVAIEKEFPSCIFISATRGINVVNLLDKMQILYHEKSNIIKLVLPYSEMKLISQLYMIADVLKKDDLDEGIRFELRVNEERRLQFDNSFKNYMVKNV